MLSVICIVGCGLVANKNIIINKNIKEEMLLGGFLDIEITWVPLRVKCPNNFVREVEHPLAAPYEVFGALHRAGPGQFFLSMYGSNRSVSSSQYWEILKQRPDYDHHAFHDPHLGTSEQLAKSFSWMVHQDGAEVYNSTTYMMWHWVSGLADLRDISVTDALFMIGMVEESMMCPETEEDIVDFLVYNAAILESGVYPDHGFRNRELSTQRQAVAGQPLAGGYNALFNGWCGDWKEKWHTHKFEHFYLCNFLCE